MRILAHRKAMIRHSKHVEAAQCDVLIRLPDSGTSMPHPGLHFILHFADGSDQRVIFEAGVPLDKLAEAVRLAQAGCAK